MKKTVRNLILVCVFFCLVTRAYPSTVCAEEKTPKLSKTSMTMYISNASSKYYQYGQYYFLTVSNAKKRPVWSSSNKNVVTVSKNGTVIVKKVGKAVVTAKTGNKKLRCKITVKKEPKSTTIKKSVVISKKLENTTLQTTVKNKLSVAVAVYYKIKEYDSNGVLLNTVSISTHVYAKEKVENFIMVEEGTAYVDITKTVMILNKCDIKKRNTLYNATVVMRSKDVEVTLDNIEVKEGWMGKEVNITYTLNNKYARTIGGVFYVVFYKEGKMVGFERVGTLLTHKSGKGQQVYSTYGYSCLEQAGFEYDTAKVVKGAYYAMEKCND